MAMQEFYRNCYLINGWIPAQVLTHGIEIGDVFQIDGGKTRTLLNIRDARLVEPVHIIDDISLEHTDWCFSNGMEQTYCEAQTVIGNNGMSGRIVRQALTFAREGDFVFHARSAKARFLKNWPEIASDLILKLTQLHYSFRHVYVVTAVAHTHDWVLAVAAQDGAKLETTSQHEDMDWFSQMTDTSSRTESLAGILRFDIGRDRPAHFYKAKKLCVSDVLANQLLLHVLERRHHLSADMLANWLAVDCLNLLRTNELNLNTAIDAFGWTAMTLDDVVKLAD